MADSWSETERQTNRLVRAIAAWLFRQKRIQPDQLSGLVRLTWITSSHVNLDAYIKSVKIPALEMIFDADYSDWSLAAVATDVSKRTKNPALKKLVLDQTAFTNTYNAYRNSSTQWMQKNYKAVLPLMKAAFALRTDGEGRSIAEGIDRLPPIKRPDKSNALHPANFLTPVMFALDKRIRFPILNGRKHVKWILKQRGVAEGTLAEKFDAMVDLIGKAGIRDAADLDQVSDQLENFLGNGRKRPKRKLLRKKNTSGKNLGLKDEDDIEVVQLERTSARKSLHNKMTNRLTELWGDFTLTEGEKGKAQYDVLIKSYNGRGTDLLIEVKSSSETANLRMAVGQLYSYAFGLDKEMNLDLCVLIPERPSVSDAAWLDAMEIGVIWFAGSELETNCAWLSDLASRVQG